MAIMTPKKQTHLVQVDVVVIAAAARVLSKQALLVGLVDGLLQDDALVEVLAADVHVAGASAHGEADLEDGGGWVEEEEG